MTTRPSDDTRIGAVAPVGVAARVARVDASAESAAALLRKGGVIAYPTEAVWGLGCDPFDESAARRLLAIKQRPVDKGMILVSASIAQFDGLLDWDALEEHRRNDVRATWPGPHTWIVPATRRVPQWITGAHSGVAVRVSAHPIVRALCEAFGGVLVSTSANRAGHAPASTLEALDPHVVDAVDAVVAGRTSGNARPTAIRDAASGVALRE